MPTFIDESGKFDWDNPQASTYFTLAAVWFETPESAFACQKVIADVRTALHVPQTYHFHFTGSTHAHRMAFLTAVSVCDFEYVTCTLQKKPNGKWRERAWRKRPYFYEEIIRPVVKRLEGRLQKAEENKKTPLNERVTFDEKTDKVYYETLRNEFYRPKAPSGRSLVNKVRPGKSESNSLVQLADMVCGAVVHTLDASAVYADLLSGRKIDHITLP